MGVRDMHLERGAADDGAVRVGIRQAEILDQRHRRGAGLGGGAEQTVHVGQRQPGIVQRSVDALRHQVDRAHQRGDGAQIGFRCADDGDTAAGDALAHHASSAGVNTG